ncbi:hypothetical protein A2V68_01635 [candidate division Kazan bacterium RBG_13_50_9]|uniref:Glycosyltransferase RgtA/B/C/D-like domain-containing protein n=1 Tax=candidate division Kazan bacterium RBG_13_50_9 TaxID=1798535 RepID=A0A1F4NSW7_UNCK3|nr:MAG: hypothetical protein A2V68_01635 [candidate division Kazan bacterium RBG_13_50_9]
MKILKLLKATDWRVNLFVMLAGAFTVLLAARPPLDPDLGWHLRNGQDVLLFGAPPGDLYSHTMAGYPWISHEWLTDVLIYLVNHYWGLLALSIIFALITFAAYFIAARVAKTRIESAMVAIMVAGLVALPILGIRPQMLTLLGLAATLWLLFRWRENPSSRIIYWLVPLTLLWVNMHGGFAAGLILAGVFGALELSKYLLKKYRPGSVSGPVLPAKRIWELAGVGLASLAVTFINPYTWRIYEELFRTIFNEVVRTGIAEWLPVAFSNPQSYNLTIYSIFVGVLLAFSWRRLDSTKIGIGVVFFFISIASWRNMPLFPLVTLPLVSEMIEVLSPKGIYYYLRSWWVILALLAVVGYSGRERFYTVIPLSTNEALVQLVGKYPYSAVQYIKEHKLPGKLFNEYNWGGYLIWKLPEKKVFIDGRMAIWKTSEQDVFQEYLITSNAGTAAPTILDKYDVDLALVYTQKPLAQYLVAYPDEWRLIYQDKLASLFQRISKNN